MYDMRYTSDCTCALYPIHDNYNKRLHIKANISFTPFPEFLKYPEFPEPPKILLASMLYACPSRRQPGPGSTPTHLTHLTHHSPQSSACAVLSQCSIVTCAELNRTDPQHSLPLSWITCYFKPLMSETQLLILTPHPHHHQRP